MISGGAAGYSFRDWLRFLLITHGLSAPALRKLALRAQTCDRRRCQCVRPDESLAMSSQICIRLPLAVISCFYGLVVMGLLLYSVVMVLLLCLTTVVFLLSCCYVFFSLYIPGYFLYNFYREIYWEVEIYVC